MSISSAQRGGAPVGFLSELDALEAASVIYLRSWCEGARGNDKMLSDFSSCLGERQGQHAMGAFEELCRLCAQFGRRPLMRHALNFKCLGSDEACFANFIGAAANRDRDDAMMIATLLVRSDMAPQITSLATDFGLALKRMNMSSRQATPRTSIRNLADGTFEIQPEAKTLH
ncbi:hypothetical protein KO498_16310 [Lentibacter algarum]|uniref:hypothetical protein n=1 Tax=Lentibacter algarum TaxID=576131 RepID=UPI001C09E1AF|nr:hypothetical protein [Lentibacter algarum]MBU2983371.1 hypothetical protein [Lentibacter algarum]